MRLIGWEEFLDLLFPYNHCLLCNNLISARDIEREIKFCSICQQKLANYVCCVDCAAFLHKKDYDYQNSVHHKLCNAADPALSGFLQGMTAAAPYVGNVREALLKLKYKGRKHLARPLGQEMAQAWRKTGWPGDVILPVPLFEAKMKERGYNQCTLLAEECGRKLGLPVLDNAIIRVRSTEVQNQLNPTERAQNVAEAFACGPDAQQLEGKTIILLDDIITTGATMRACCAALQMVKPAAIYGLAMAGKLVR